MIRRVAHHPIIQYCYFSMPQLNIQWFTNFLNSILLLKSFKVFFQWVYFLSAITFHLSLSLYPFLLTLALQSCVFGTTTVDYHQFVWPILLHSYLILLSIVAASCVLAVSTSVF